MIDYISALAEHCKHNFEDMAKTEVLKVSIKRDQRPNEIFAAAQMISFEEVDHKLSGTFTLGFTDQSTAIFVASAIAINMGFDPVTDLGENASDILGEFLNTIMGHAVSSWDKMGRHVKFGLPTILESSPIKKNKNGNIDAFVIILQLKVESITFRISVKTDTINKLRGKRILVVDDSHLIREMIKKLLINHTVEVDVAEDGLMAIEKFESFHPDITIMDINMPKLNGLEAIMRIRSIDKNSKFVILSSSSRQDEVVTAKTLNVNAYLIKPFNEEKLFNVINKLIEN